MISLESIISLLFLASALSMLYMFQPEPPPARTLESYRLLLDAATVLQKTTPPGEISAQDLSPLGPLLSKISQNTGRCFSLASKYSSISSCANPLKQKLSQKILLPAKDEPEELTISLSSED